MDCLRAPGRIRILFVTKASNGDDRYNLWDSNAENVRRRGRLKLKGGSISYSDSKQGKRRTPFQVEDEDFVDDNRGQRSSFQFQYEDDDAYEYYDADEDEYFFDWKIFLGVLGLPVAFVGIPWIVGHPMAFTMALAVVPMVQRAISLWSSFFKGSRRRPTEYRRSRTRKRDPEEYYKDNSDEEEDYLYDKSSWENTKQEVAENNAREMPAGSGWYELEEDRKLMMQQSRKRKFRMNRFKARKKMPLFWRILLTLFPFLRSWGGFV